MTAKRKPRARNSVPRKPKTSARRRPASSRLVFASPAAVLKYVIDRGLAVAAPAPKSAPSTGLIKLDSTAPCFIVTGPQSILIKAGTKFAGVAFAKDTALPAPSAGFVTGADYGVFIKSRRPVIERVASLDFIDVCLGGFHYAPGGNASDHAGGDSTPQINPRSLWDQNFRPSCPDPRGMHLECLDGNLYWLDTYLLGREHLTNGTSAYGVTIADHYDPPQNPAGGYFTRLDYATAVTVMKHHGKTLASVAELQAAANGVTENSSAKCDPKITGLDAARTGRNGMQQATGNMWAWCHDGTPEKRASLFGGSWWRGGSAGWRDAVVAYTNPEYSDGDIGARGRGDHMELA